jgi:hypothetical protein
MTFENFSFSEKNNSYSSLRECLYLGISEPTIEHEKLLADLFDCSLSHIECVNPQQRIFQVDSDELESVIVYTDSELDILYENMLDYFVNDFLKRVLSSEGISFGKLVDVVDSVLVREKVESSFSLVDCRSKLCEILSGKEVVTISGLVIEL